MQTPKQSLYEAFINVAIGYIISLVSLSILLPLMGIETTASKNLQITLYFTIISIVRTYSLRRYFNKPKRFLFKLYFLQFKKFMQDLAKNCPRETKW